VVSTFYCINVVAVNTLGLALHDTFPSHLQEIQQRERCEFTAYYLCSGITVAPFLWPNFAKLNVYQFRSMTLRYRHRAYFQQLFAKLSQLGEFREMWTTIPFTEQDFYTALKSHCYLHPHYGPLDYHVTVIPIVTAWGKLYFSTLTPLDVPTFEVFSTLVHTVGADILKLTPWPHPTLYPTLEGEDR
jgi:hypothetical protein